MNNPTTNITNTAVLDAIIQENYSNYFYSLSVWSSTVLICYAALLNIGQEVEFIWFKSFSWPALLYLFTRYGTLFYISFTTWLSYFPSWERACTVLIIFIDLFEVFGLIGIQGLLMARAYSLSGKNRILSTVFIFMLLSGAILELTDNIIFNGCTPSDDRLDSLLSLLININVIFTDLLVFAVCMWKIWGIWKLGRQTGIRGRHSLASILVKQSVLRYCFVILISIANTIVGYLLPSTYITYFVGYYQNVLSSIMMANFTLDLRCQNSASIQASNISLSSIKLSNILQNIEQSILVEMATPNPEVEGPNVGDDNVDVDHDDTPATVSDIQPA